MKLDRQNTVELESHVERFHGRGGAAEIRDGGVAFFGQLDRRRRKIDSVHFAGHTSECGDEKSTAAAKIEHALLAAQRAA
jgi:hypothetical protein